MRTRSPRAGAAVAVLALLLLGGCAAGGPSAPAAVTASGPAATSGPTAAPPIVPSGPTSSPPATTAGTASGAPAADCAPCGLEDLGVALGRPGTGAQPRTAIVWTNTSTRECTLYGFPGLELQSAPSGRFALDADRYTVPRGDRTPATVTLGPGEAAHATLTYLPADPATNPTFTPALLLTIPPGGTRPAVLDWPFGPVLDQRDPARGGGGRAGTVVDPVEPGAA